MNSFRSPSLVVLATSAALVAVPALAQTTTTAPPPSRNANVWDNREHQPGPGVHSEEQSAGVALPPSVRRQQTDEVERLQQQILQRAHQGTADGVMGGGTTQPTR